MVNKSTETPMKAEEATKNNKATMVVQLRMGNPEMTNVDVAKQAGCSQTYSSKIWSDYMKAKGNTTKPRRKAKNAAPIPTKVKRVTANRKATTTTSSSNATSVKEILNARAAMQSIVDGVGGCAAKNLLEDVTST